MASMSSSVAFRPLMGLQSTLALSPDGTMVAYADDRTGQFNATVAPLDAGATRTLTSFTDRTVRQLAWHPTESR
jgi:Tol biopolymer transport system component